MQTAAAAARRRFGDGFLQQRRVGQARIGRVENRPVLPPTSPISAQTTKRIGNYLHNLVSLLSLSLSLVISVQLALLNLRSLIPQSS